MIFIFLLIAQPGDLASIDNNIDEYLKIQDISDQLDDIKEIEIKLAKINLLIKSGCFDTQKDKFRIDFMNLIKTDLVKIKKMNAENRVEFEKSYRNFLDFGFSLNKSTFTSNTYEKLCGLEKMVWKKFGEFSYVHFCCIKYRFGFSIELDTNSDYTEKLDSEISNFKKIYGSENPEFDYFYDYYCCINENKKNSEILIYYSRKSIESMKKYYPKNSPFLLGPQGYLISGLVNTGRFNEAYSEFKKIHEPNLKIEDAHASKVLFRLYKSSSLMFEKIGKLEDAINAQDKALEKMCQFLPNKDRQLESELKTLKDLMIKNGNDNKFEIYEKKFKIKNP